MSSPIPALLTAVLAVGAAPALAAPRVIADIAPVQSIVAAVMEGVGAPDLVVPPGASEHDYSLRPSEAAALADADLVVWAGPALTPWLQGALDALAGDALRLTLMEAPGLSLLPVREGGPFEPHLHEEAAHDHAGHEHEHAEHADHGHSEAPEGAVDAHVWLDPANAALMAEAIAAALGGVDPENAAVYAANAANFAEAMDALSAEVAERLEPARGRPFFVFHDAYQYFEARFDMPAAGSISLGSAEPPSAARASEIRARFESEDVACVFTEPQFEPRLVATLIEGTSIRTGALDPLGVDLPTGPELYPALIREMANDLAACLAPES